MRLTGCLTRYRPEPVEAGQRPGVISPLSSASTTNCETDGQGLTIDLSSLRSIEKPALVTTGTTSGPFFGPIAEIVAQALPMSTLRRFEGAGHVPHISHPDLYVELIRHYCEHTGAAPPATSARAI